MSVADHALELIGKGYHVFPLRQYIDSESGEKKIDYLCKWKTEAVDRDSVSAEGTYTQFGEEVPWEAFWDQATNVGIACGPSGLVVLDFDTEFVYDEDDYPIGETNKGDLLRELDRLDSEHYDITSAPLLDTSRGGFHLYLRANPDHEMRNSQKRVSPSVDVRGVGGMVVVHDPSGIPEIDACPQVPEWLAAINRRAEDATDTPEGEERPPEYSENEDGTSWGLKALAGSLAVIRDSWEADAGTFNHDLNSACFRIGQAISGGQLDAHSASQSVWDLFHRLGVPDDQIKTALSGLKDGRKHPRWPEGDMFKPVERNEAVTDEALAEMQSQLLTLDGLRDMPPPRWLPGFDGWLEAGSFVHLVGPAGEGKSFVALDWMACLASGKSWPDRTGQRLPKMAIYVVAEGASGTVLRADAWDTGIGGVHDPYLRFLPRALQIRQREWDVFIEMCRILRPALVTVDTQARCTTGVEENSSKDMGEIIARVNKLQEATGATVVLVHHTGKAEGAVSRGSSAQIGAVDTEIAVSMHSLSKRITVKCRKQKNSEAPAPLHFTLEPVEGTKSVVLTKAKAPRPDKDENPTRFLIKATLKSSKDPMSAGELAKSTKVDPARIRRVLQGWDDCPELVVEPGTRGGNACNLYRWVQSPGPTGSHVQED